MKVIKLSENELESLVMNIIQEVKFNTINYSDLSKSGDWDSRRYAREEKGIEMYKLDDGVLKKITKRKVTDKIFFLTAKEFERANQLLQKAIELESQAKEFRSAAKFIMQSGSDS
jgi:hypothetical protein